MKNRLFRIKKYLSSHFWGSIMLITIGLVALATLVVGLFFSFGDRTKYLWSAELRPVNSQEFLEAIARLSNSPIESGGEIKILQNGDEFLPELLGAIKNAQSTVNFTAYIWEDGQMSDVVLDALIERARGGVEVRLLLDGFGGHAAPQKKLDELVAAGGHVERFRVPAFGKFMRLHRRNHRRAIVIDGNIGFTGGMAIADHWLGNARNTKEWRDTMFEVTGNMAKSLQSAFAQLWAGTYGEILEGQKFYPDTTPQNTAGPAARYVNVVSSPASDTQPLSKFFWLSITSAQKRIVLNSSYVIPDKHIRSALIDRAKNGVEVILLLPGTKTDAKPIRLASQFYYKDYLEAGIKIYEYKPSMIHSKIMVVDGKWSVIGSPNMDLRSVELNEENAMGILDENLAVRLEKMLNDDIKNSDQLNLDGWKKRGVLHKLGEALFVNFAKQY